MMWIMCNSKSFFVYLFFLAILCSHFSRYSYRSYEIHRYKIHSSPLHIPLPLLSFDSCLQIIAKKDPTYNDLVQVNHQLRVLISDVGGHCRALEILYDGLSRYTLSTSSYFPILPPQVIANYQLCPKIRIFLSVFG